MFVFARIGRREMSEGCGARRRTGNAEPRSGEARSRRPHRRSASGTDAGYRIETVFCLTRIALDFVAGSELVALSCRFPYQFIDAHPHDPLRLVEVLELPRVVG